MKLEQAAREVVRQHSMECLSDKAITALREALAEQAEQEPLMITPGGGAFPIIEVDYVGEFAEPIRSSVVPLDWSATFTPVQQEPVAWLAQDDTFWLEKGSDTDIPLYAAPVRTKDLTNSEKLYILGSHIDPITKDVMGLSLIDAVIAAYKEKNK